VKVYVETNFILELVFGQEQYASCEQIMTLAQTGEIALIAPAYCLAEPHEKLTRQARNRKSLQQALDLEKRQLERAAPYAKRINSITDIANLLAQSVAEEKQRFVSYRRQLLATAEIVPLTTDILRQGAEYETLYDLTPQDALVLASVITHLQQNQANTACFLNKNSKDFDNPEITDELAQYNCRLISRFDDGYQFLQAELGRTA
jgi:predicted nucleic acid-binding protein